MSDTSRRQCRRGRRFRPSFRRVQPQRACRQRRAAAQVPGGVEREVRRILVRHQLRRGGTDRPGRRHVRAQVRAQRRRRDRLPGRDGRPAPRRPAGLGIGEVDGPYHLALRRALAPFFSPRRRRQRCGRFMEQSVHWFLDQRIGDGQMDLVLDYASPVPAILTMKLMGLPVRQLAAVRQPLPLGDGRPQDSDEYLEAIAKCPQ